MRRIIIDGNQCYEIDEDCMKKKRRERREREDEHRRTERKDTKRP